MILRIASLAGLIALYAALPAAGQNDCSVPCGIGRGGLTSRQCKACFSLNDAKFPCGPKRNPDCSLKVPKLWTPEALRAEIGKIEGRINSLWNEMIKHGMALQEMNKVCRACTSDPDSYDNCPAAHQKCAELPAKIKKRRADLEKAKVSRVMLEKKLIKATAMEKKAGEDAKEKNFVESLWKEIQEGVASLKELVDKLEEAVDPDSWSRALGEKLKDKE